MGFLTDLFHHEKKEESVVLIDVGASSVAGAYAHYTEGELPVLLYSRRVSVEAHADEAPEAAMLRTLQALGETLISEGAPALSRSTGSGKVSGVLVSIDAPWQSTSVRVEHFEQDDPFVFTKNLITEKLRETGIATPGKLLADESIIGTILNGYETGDPYGREVHRASAIILTSLIDEKVADGVRSTLQSLYHTKNILPIAGSSLRYQAMRRACPHEREALIVDATGPLASIALVRKGLLVAIVDVPDSTTGSDSWIQGVIKELADLAKHYPLPRTIFLLARESDADLLQKTLTGAKLSELWLSDNPPKVVSLLASHLSGLVHQTAESSPDLLLLLMVLYWQYRASDYIT